MPTPNDIALSTLKQDEGLRLRPYRCTAGKVTIGYGRNLEDKGISEAEAEALLETDIDEAIDQLSTLPCWGGLNNARRGVLVNMYVNLGPSRFVAFRKMRHALDAGDYSEAAEQIRDSKAYRTNAGLRARYERLAVMMATGQYAEKVLPRG